MPKAGDGLLGVGDAPLGAVELRLLVPGGIAERSATLVDAIETDHAKLQVLCPRLAAEVEVVEVKRKSFVEADSLLDKAIAVDGDECSIEQGNRHITEASHIFDGFGRRS